jgi:hypothetical protein
MVQRSLPGTSSLRAELAAFRSLKRLRRGKDGTTKVEEQMVSELGDSNGDATPGAKVMVRHELEGD